MDFISLSLFGSLFVLYKLNEKKETLVVVNPSYNNLFPMRSAEEEGILTPVFLHGIKGGRKEMGANGISDNFYTYNNTEYRTRGYLHDLYEQNRVY